MGEDPSAAESRWLATLKQMVQIVAVEHYGANFDRVVPNHADAAHWTIVLKDGAEDELGVACIRP